MITQLRLYYLFLAACVLCVAVHQPVEAQWLQQVSGVTDNLYCVYFVDADHGHAVGWGASPGAVALRTEDGGENWSRTGLATGRAS